MKVSIIIPTLEPNYDEFKELLLNLKKDKLTKEIIIIDSGSNKKIINLIKNFADKLIEIKKGEFNHGTTRNLASKEAKGEFLLFLTQDVALFDDKLLTTLIKPFEKNPKLVSSYAKQIAKKDANPIEVFSREFNYPNYSILKSKDKIKELGIKTFFSSNSCAIYEREIFEELKGFRDVIVSEDMEFCTRAILSNYEIFYNHEAKIYHSHNLNLIEIFKRYRKIGKFFKNNSWIKEYSTPNKEGLKYTIEEKKYLLKERKFFYLFYSFIQNFVKFISFKITDNSF